MQDFTGPEIVDTSVAAVRESNRIKKEKKSKLKGKKKKLKSTTRYPRRRKVEKKIYIFFKRAPRFDVPYSIVA
jgi:hypothetical protein